MQRWELFCTIIIIQHPFKKCEVLTICSRPQPCRFSNPTETYLLRLASGTTSSQESGTARPQLHVSCEISPSSTRRARYRHRRRLGNLVRRAPDILLRRRRETTTLRQRRRMAKTARPDILSEACRMKHELHLWRQN